MLQCYCQGYLHHRCSNLPAYQVLNFSKTNRKFTCKRCTNEDHEMIKEKFVKGILETKDNRINNEVQHLKDEKQKRNNKFKSEKTLNSILKGKKQQTDKPEKDIRHYNIKKNTEKKKIKELNLRRYNIKEKHRKKNQRTIPDKKRTINRTQIHGTRSIRG